MKHPDYSAYLDRPGMLDYIEQEWLKNPDLHKKQADSVMTVVHAHALTAVIEVGCSTGNTAKLLNVNNYLGIDGNLASLFLAMMKNPGKPFVFADIRTVKIEPRELVCAFAILKHFSLSEWSKVFKKILSLGTYAVFDLPISKQVIDDGKEYHHVWMTDAQIRFEIEQAGHDLLQVFFPGTVEPVFFTRVKQK